MMKVLLIQLNEAVLFTTVNSGLFCITEKISGGLKMKEILITKGFTSKQAENLSHELATVVTSDTKAIGGRTYCGRYSELIRQHKCATDC